MNILMSHKKKAKNKKIIYPGYETNDYVNDSQSYISLQHIDKIYSNNIQAVFDFNLDIKEKEFIVLVGPSGCGKSTTLRMIAGLEDITKGDLYIENKLCNGVLPKDRDIAMVFQSYALYPHLTVFENLAFGLRSRNYPKDEIKEKVLKTAKILELEEYLERKPKELSGGQRQRVALGRAIARSAKAYLMDEPLSNLDAKLRVNMRSEIVKLHESIGATTIYVTHDQTEAMTMATRIVVMKDGFIQQIGTPFEVYNKPKNLFVASFIGTPAMNIIEGIYDENKITLVSGLIIELNEKQVSIHNEFYKKYIKNANNVLKEYQSVVLNEGNEEEVNEIIFHIEKDIYDMEQCLRKPHRIIFGIRPEDLYIHDEHSEKLYGKTMINIHLTVAEMLGKEYIIHANYANIDLIANIHSTSLISSHEEIELVIDLNRMHVFDPITTNLIL